MGGKKGKRSRRLAQIGPFRGISTLGRQRLAASICEMPMADLYAPCEIGGVGPLIIQTAKHALSGWVAREVTASQKMHRVSLKDSPNELDAE